MRKPLTGLGVLAVIVGCVTAVATFVVSVKADWYMAIYPFAVGLLALCVIGILANPKKKRGAA